MLYPNISRLSIFIKKYTSRQRNKNHSRHKIILKLLNYLIANNIKLPLELSFSIKKIEKEEKYKRKE
jgi:hypothetical protein